MTQPAKPRTTETVTTALDLLGILLLVAFAVVVWWPAALLVGGVAALAVSRGLAAPRRVPSVGDGA